MITPSKRPSVQTDGDWRFKSTPVHKIPSNTARPMKDLLKMAESNRDRVHRPNPLDSEKKPSNRHIKVTNSTVVDDINGHGEIALELSSITADHSSSFCRTWNGQKMISNVMQPKSVESPAKVFARLKAKVLSENKLQQNRDDTASGQVHQGPNKTPRKSEQPFLNGEVKKNQESHQATYDVEALTLSPLPNPVKGARFQCKQTLSLDMQKGFRVTPKSPCAALKPVSECTPVKWYGPLSSCPPAPSVHPLDDDLSTDGDLQDVPFVVPKVPVRNAPLRSALRPDLSQNSPAKIFTLMKGKVELQKRQQEGNQVGSTVDAIRGEAALGSVTRSLTVTSGDESDSEVFRVMDAISPAPSTAGSSLNPEEPIVGTFESVHAGPVHGLLPDIVDDALLQNSPRISIPKKRATVFQKGAREESTKPKKKQDRPPNEIHLKEWQLKMVNSSFFVDGVRVDNNMPWHSNLIAERISSSTLKTVSGSIYVLFGRMVPGVDNPLPGWLQKKFLFGFPEKWKVYLQDYLAELKSCSSGSDKNKQKSKGSQLRPAHKQSKSTSKRHTPRPSAADTPRSSTRSVEVSRSGRLVKPPLEFWKGARVIVDSEMNVSIQESYMSAPTPLVKWKRAKVFTSPQSTERVPSKGVRRQRSAGPKRARAESTPDPGSSESRGVAHQQQPGGEGEGAVRAAKHLAVELMPLIDTAQLKRCCQKNNLHLSLKECDPGKPGVRSASLNEAQGRSGSEDDEPPAPQRRVKQYLKAKDRPRKEITPPGSRAVKEATDTQPATHSKLLRGRLEVQKALLGSDTDCTPGPLTRTGRRVRHSRFKNAADTLQTDGSSLEADTPASRQRPRLQARWLAERGPAKVGWSSTDPDTPEGQRHHPRSCGRRSSDSDGGARPPRDRDLADRGEGGDGKRDAAADDAGDEGEGGAKALRGKSRATRVDRLPQSSSDDQGKRQVSKAAVAARPAPGRRARHAAVADSSSEQDDFQPSPEERGCKKVSRLKKKGGERTQQAAESPERSREVRKGKKRNEDVKAANKRKEEEEDDDDDDDAWTERELDKLQKAVSHLPKHQSGFWVNVAMTVGTRSATECQEQYTRQQSLKVRRSRKKAGPSKEEPVKEPLLITAKVGTLKRKKQVRNLLDNMPKDNHDDVFTGSPLQSKRVKLPTLSTNAEEHMFQQLQQNPQTPSSSHVPLVKTPQCLHISPGMLGSINRNNNDNYVYKLQKKMGKDWAGLRGPGSPFQDKYTITPFTKSKRGSDNAKNQSFAVWEMFSDKDPAPLPSDESGEEDYYFVDD